MAETTSEDIKDLQDSQPKECPHVLISLRPKPQSEEIEDSPIPFTDVFESLYQRQQALGSKLSTLRMTHKANIISQMRQVPEINENSRKIAENLNQDLEKLLESPSTKTKENSKSSKKVSKLGKKSKTLKKPKGLKPKKGKKTKYDSILSSPMSSELFKHSRSLDFLSLPVSPQKSPKSVVDRVQCWKEERDKRLADKKREKDISDMLECTFTPYLISRSEVNDTGSVITKSKSRFSFRTASPSKCMSPLPEYPSKVALFSCLYSQISPVKVTIAYDSGYNQKDFLSRAKPMACYQLDNSYDSF